MLQIIASSLNASIYVILAGFFAFFGSRFYKTRAVITASVVLSRITRVDVLNKLILVAAMLTVIFLLRFSLIVKQLVNDNTTQLWWFDPVRFLLCFHEFVLIDVRL